MNIVLLKSDMARRLFLLAISGGILLSLYTKLNHFDEGMMSISRALLEGLGTLEIETIFNVLQTIAFSLPFLLFMMNTGDFIFSEYASKGTIVLTRLKDKKTWLMRMLFNMCKLCFCYLLTLFSTFLCVSLFLGYSLEFTNIREISYLFLLKFLLLVSLSMLSNTLCFMTRSGLGYVIVITIYYLSLFTSGFIYNVVPKWLICLPTSQSIMSWHHLPFRLGESMFMLEQFTLVFSVCYLLVINLLIYSWLYKVVKEYENY